jgi:hypothetical protein
VLRLRINEAISSLLVYAFMWCIRTMLLFFFTNQCTKGLFVNGNPGSYNRIFTWCADSHHLTKSFDIWQKRIILEGYG